MNVKMKMALAGLMVMLLPGGCGTEKPQRPAAVASQGAVPSPEVVMATPVSMARDYKDARDLAESIRVYGTNCNGFSEEPAPLFAESQGDCWVGQDQVVIGVYKFDFDREQNIAFKVGMLAGIAEFYEVVGGNWALGCDRRQFCADLAGSLGGELRTYPA